MIHKFSFDGTNIVLDVHSGAVHVVDQLVWAILEYYGQKEPAEIIDILKGSFPVEEIREGLEELDSLKESGQLFSSDTHLEEYHIPAEPILKSLCLHIAHDCNLRCSYCFAGTGNFGGDRSLMSLEVGRKAIDLLIQRSGPRRNCEIDFFGGEPLLNFKVVQDLVAYGRQGAAEAGKEFKFTLTTNAILLTPEIEKWLNDNGISVVLSLDGRPHVNDNVRTYVDGSGCYDEILPNIKRFVESRNNENYYVRGTFTHHNLDFSQDVLHLVDQGLNLVSVEPVVAPPEEDYAFKPEDLPILEEEYEKLTRAYLTRAEQGQPFNFFHFNLDLTGGPCLPKRLSGCGAGHEYLAVAPGGKLYPCHQFVGREEFLVGDVFAGHLNGELMKNFQKAHVYNKEKCQTCWAKFYCSGGCHANAYGANHDLYQPYEIGCRLEKKRLECAIYLQVKKSRKYS
ncbi:MAG: thioether cross-link-forming SCIFF peptide maturase [Thermincolia bacterium]